MSDAAYIELPPEPQKKSGFFRSWRGAVLLLFIAAVILAACFSWWLAQGKISSAFARVDTVVFTVEPDATARVASILVRRGEDVRQGQPLATLNPEIAAGVSQPRQANQDAVFAGRLAATMETEKKLSAQLSQARADEELYQKIYQERVTEHVRWQLALRSHDRGNPVAYEQVSGLVAAAKARMEQAREEFEKVSKARAAMEVELGRIRTELVRKKLRSGAVEKETVQTQEPPRPEVQLATLYAPIAGKIMDMNVIQGQVVHRGQPLFMILPGIVSNNDIWIQAWFPVDAQDKLKPGQKTQIKAGDLHLAGTVSAIGPESQLMPPEAGRQGNRRYLPVRIQLENEKDLARLNPGAKVECQIQTRYVVGEGLF